MAGGVNGGALQRVGFQLPGNLDLIDWTDLERPKSGDRLGFKDVDRVNGLAAGGANDRPVCAAPLLDRLFIVALRNSDRAASEEVVGGTRRKGKPTAEFKRLETSRLAACNALEDLDSMTGRDFAMAAACLKGNVELNPESKYALGLVNAAVKAQQAFAKELVDCAVTRPIGDPTRTALLQLAMRANARAGAILDLVDQVGRAIFAAQDAEDRKFQDRRGFLDILFAQEAKKSAGLQKLLVNGSADFVKGGGTGALAAEFNRLREKFDVAGGDLKCRHLAVAVAHNLVDGIEIQGRAKDMLKALDDVCGKMKQIGKDRFLQSLPKGMRGNAIEKMRGSLRQAFADFKESMNQLIDVYAAKGRDDPAVRKALKNVYDRVDALDTLYETLSDWGRAVTDLVKKNNRGGARHADNVGLNQLNGSSINFPERVSSVPGDWKLLADNLKKVIFPPKKRGRFAISGDEVNALIDGTRRLSTATEARIWGESSVDAELDGARLVEARPIGSGKFNEVKLCTFVKRDGTTVKRVFRPENGALESIKRGGIAWFLQQDPGISGITYSLASGAVAKLIGCEDVFTKTTFGTLNGQPGMFCEYAEGESGGSFLNSTPENGPFSDIGNMDAKSKVAGEVSRKLNRLQWLDFLTGQVDRHMNNLMIGQTGEGADRKVSVKGIDNDECFPDCSIGAGLFVFDSEDEAFKFISRKWKGFPEPLTRADIKRCSVKLKGQAGKFLRKKFVLDINKMSLANRLHAISMTKSFGMPDYIDAELKDKLLNLSTYQVVSSLRELGLSKNQVIMTVARLHLIKDALGKMPAEKVLDEEKWRDPAALADRDGKDETADKFVREIHDQLQHGAKPGSDDDRRRAINVQKSYGNRVGFTKYMFR